MKDFKKDVNLDEIKILSEEVEVFDSSNLIDKSVKATGQTLHDKGPILSFRLERENPQRVILPSIKEKDEK